MKKNLMLLPVLAVGLASCGTANQMICLIDQSTEAIHCNREAVESSTVVIDENAMIINASTETIKENGRRLQAIHNEA